MQTHPTPPRATAWRLQDAKAQFSELVNNAMRGVPQHVTRHGRQAVVVLSQEDFEALQRNAANRPRKPAGLIDHLLAMPKTPVQSKSKAKQRTAANAKFSSLDLQPREIDFS
jgi:prevent-host-death family protein